MKIILASASPRRREILSLLGIPFEVMPSACEEAFEETDPAKLVCSLSRQKGEEVAGRLSADMENPTLVLAADTIVWFQGRAFGKPANQEEAYETLRILSGHTHQVYTGVYLGMVPEQSVNITQNQNQNKAFPRSFSVMSEVTFCPLKEEELRWYVSTKEPYDKAGAYAVQGVFAPFIEKINGDYYNVMGLPISRVYHELKQAGIDLLCQ